jgi:hypothetical protein
MSATEFRRLEGLFHEQKHFAGEAREHRLKELSRTEPVLHCELVGLLDRTRAAARGDGDPPAHSSIPSETR